MREKIRTLAVFLKLLIPYWDKSLISLLSLLIQEARIANDTAASPEFLSNQGKIGAYSDLKDIILKGNPGSAR